MEWQNEHRKIIDSFLSELFSHTEQYVLKGGTALMKCYGLDRFSEDIDLDGHDDEIFSIINAFCEKNEFQYRIAKDTQTVKRALLHYDGNKPLKIEVSCRRKEIPKEEILWISGIKVYNIDSLALMKCNAYQARDRIRDLCDVAFICNHFYSKLSDGTKAALQNAIAYKGIDQFDYLVNTQADELIDTDKLVEDFLNMYDRLGLLISEEEKEEILNIERGNIPDIKKQTTGYGLKL